MSMPNPCREDWGQMEKRDGGRFCMNCRQTVIDFTQMTDKELFNYFALQQTITCGRFNTNQLNRAIQPVKILLVFHLILGPLQPQ